MRGSLALALLCAMLAGCTDSSDDAAVDSVASESMAPLEEIPEEVKAEPEWEEVVVPVSFEGNLGTFYSYCQYDTDSYDCNGNAVTQGNTDHYPEVPEGTWTAVDLVMAWTSSSYVTDSLTFGVMQMGEQNHVVTETTGTSPITVTDNALNLALHDATGIHLYAWNPHSYQDLGAGVAFFGSVDQAYTIEGTVTVLVPADDTE